MQRRRGAREREERDTWPMTKILHLQKERGSIRGYSGVGG